MARVLLLRHGQRTIAPSLWPWRSRMQHTEAAEDAFNHEFGFSRVFAKKHFPDLLKPSVSDNLRPIFARLRSFDVDDMHLKALVKENRNILRTTASSTTFDEQLNFLRAYGLDDTQISDTVKKYPAILLLSVSKDLEPKVTFLKEQGLSAASITIMLTKSPRTLSADITKELTPRIAFLARNGIDRRFLGSSVAKHPQLLNYDINTRLKPVINALNGLSKEVLHQVLVKTPEVFAKKPEDLTELLNAFKYIGYSDEGDRWAESLEYGCRYGVDAVRDKIDFLMTFDIPYRDAALILKSEPYIYRVENSVLKEKLDYFLKEMKFGVRDLARVPSFLSKKLMDRVKIRWEVLSMLKNRGLIKHIYVRDLVTLPKKYFVETFVFKYPDCGRVYYGARSAVKQARSEAKGERYVSYY